MLAGDIRQQIDSVSGCRICESDDPNTIAHALGEILIRGERLQSRDSILSMDERFLIKKVIAVYEKVAL